MTSQPPVIGCRLICWASGAWSCAAKTGWCGPFTTCAVIAARGLLKLYGSHRAVDGIDLAIRRGEIADGQAVRVEEGDGALLLKPEAAA